jgi:hypothetical protein
MSNDGEGRQDDLIARWQSVCSEWLRGTKETADLARVGDELARTVRAQQDQIRHLTEQQEITEAALIEVTTDRDRYAERLEEMNHAHVDESNKGGGSSPSGGHTPIAAGGGELHPLRAREEQQEQATVRPPSGDTATPLPGQETRTEASLRHLTEERETLRKALADVPDVVRGLLRAWAVDVQGMRWPHPEGVRFMRLIEAAYAEHAEPSPKTGSPTP